MISQTPPFSITIPESLSTGLVTVISPVLLFIVKYERQGPKTTEKQNKIKTSQDSSNYPAKAI